MVIDAVTWFAEADMLRVRLAMLDGLVDRFVVVEADRTHTGLPKPWALPEDVQAHPKVVYWQVTLTAQSEWGRENEQRRAMRDAVASLNPDPDTTVVMSDCDEIWDGRLLGRDGIRVAAMDFRIFSVWWQYGVGWRGSIAGPWSAMGTADWQTLRDHRTLHPPVESGWHLSWMGDLDSLRRKQQAFAHAELAGHDLIGPVAEGRWLDGKTMRETDGLPDRLVDLAPEDWKRRRVS